VIDENKVSNITRSASILDDQYHILSMGVCVEVSAFLANFCLGKEYPKHLKDAVDACGYAEAVFSWQMNGKDPFWTYVTEDPVLLHFRKELHARFELEILTIAEHELREKLLPGKEKLRFGDFFHPLTIERI